MILVKQLDAKFLVEEIQVIITEINSCNGELLAIIYDGNRVS